MYATYKKNKEKHDSEARRSKDDNKNVPADTPPTVEPYQKPTDVMISYSHQDKEIMNKIRGRIHF